MSSTPGSSDPGPSVFLSGDRLFLAPIRREDEPIYERWFNDPEIRSFVTVFAPTSREQELAVLDRMMNQSPHEGVSLGIWLKETPARLIGNTGLFALDARNQFATLGIVLGEKSEWSKGYGRETIRLMIDYAFGTLNLRKVLLSVFGHNLRAQRAYLALGFREVGRYTAHRWIEGQWRDEIWMEILRPSE